MTTQHNALLEAMEQQAVSIAKAGVVNTLPARAAVLAAANPIGGHYNRAKTVAENLKINPALLSRWEMSLYVHVFNKVFTFSTTVSGSTSSSSLSTSPMSSWTASFPTTS